MRLSTKLTLAFACFCLSVSAFAGVTSRGGTIYVHGVATVTLKSKAQGLAAETRAGVAAALLDALGPSATVQPRKLGSDWTLVAGTSHLLLITAEDAKLHKTSPEKLATAWAARLNAALRIPPLKLGTNALTVPVGERRGIALTGHLAGEATFDSTHPQVAVAERVEGGFKVRGIGPGYALITISAGNLSERVEVTVRNPSVPLPQTVYAEVSGAPANANVVRGAIEYALRTHLKQQPQTELRFDIPATSPLKATGAATYQVRLRGNAPGALESVGYAKVVVKNEALEKAQDDELWYCNNPEIVRSAQNLFAASLRKGNSARMLYHHVNGASSGLFIRIQAVNDSDVPAKVLIIAGDAEPHIDPVKAGIDAAAKYMRSWMVGSGEILTIPPRSTTPISIRRLSPEETMSGLCSLRLLDGPDELLVRTDSWPPFPVDERWRRAIASETPWRDVGANPMNGYDTAPYLTSQLVFPNPYKALELSYEVGGRHGFVRIGQLPISRQDLALNLDGNFGVIYSIKANLNNPTDQPMDVELVFEASAGYSGGLFLLNGSLNRTPLLRPKQEARIAKVHLLPGASRTLNITTMPLSGSSYPATLSARPIVEVETSGKQSP